MLPNNMQGARPKKGFSRDQVSYDTERDLLGKPQKHGAAMKDEAPLPSGAPGKGLGTPGGQHPQTEPEGSELPNNTASEVQDPMEQAQAEGGPPSIESVSAKQDEMCQQLDKIVKHLGLDQKDENGDENGDDMGFGGASSMPAAKY